ncbi:MAG: hypothetical protein ACE5E5_12205 [Phycisphaerae bacterium]
MEQAKLLSMTTVLTVLIWTSADTLIRETATLTVAIDFVPTNPTMIVEAADPTPSCQIDISGPRRVVEAVLAQAPLNARLQVADLPTGPTNIPLDPDTLKRAIAEQQHEFRKLSVDNLKPAGIPATIDHLVTRSLEITSRHLTLDYEVAPRLSHSTVDLQLRESVLLEKTANGQPLVVDVSADIDRYFREKPAGQSIETTINLSERPFGADASLHPDQLTITATLRVQQRTAEIATVPILLAVSFANFNKALSPVSRDGRPLELVSETITVTGPPEAIAKLLRGDSRAFGIIRLKEDDLRTLETIKLVTPEFFLPPGVTLAREPKPVEFQMVAP